jgi:hypothetical protein
MDASDWTGDVLAFNQDDNTDEAERAGTEGQERADAGPAGGETRERGMAGRRRKEDDEADEEEEEGEEEDQGAAKEVVMTMLTRTRHLSYPGPPLCW